MNIFTTPKFFYVFFFKADFIIEEFNKIQNFIRVEPIFPVLQLSNIF